MIEIYRGGSVILKVRPDDNDKCTKKVMGENTVTLTVRRSSAFSFQVGDYLMFAGEKYTLNILPKVEKKSAQSYEYNLVFEGIEYELRKVHMLFYTANLVYAGGADFSLMGDAELQARVIVENMNRVQSGWTLGSVITTEAKNLTYSGNNCLEAITRIAEEFGTEYWIGTDKTVNIGKRGDIIPVTFQYGKNKGLYSIERTNVNSKDIITRLYPFGSEQNLPKGYRNNSKRLQIEGAYIEANTSLYGIIESSQTFDEIKPERTGTISGVNESDALEFSDSSMDFDINATDGEGNTTVLIPDTKAKIHFQTGDLAGYEFELSSYNHATKTFRLIKFTDEVAYDLPNSTLKPRVGDKYIILDIYMPATYVTDAEARLLIKAQESLAQNSVPNVAYKVEADPLFIKKLELTYKVGDYVHIEDEDIGIDRDIRLVGIERKLVKNNEYDFELADTVEPTLVSQILTTLERTDIVLQMNRLNDPARARRNYRVVQELQNAIFDQDGYFDNTNIKPFSIETSMLSVGSKGQQFYTDCMFQTNYGGDKNSIVVSNGALSHFTIESEIRNWTITGLSETLSDDNLRYIFIKCLKVGNTGQVVLSTSQLSIDDGTYYNFFAGVLSSVIDNARQVSLLFGFTTINGRFIKTGRIQSADGSTYFDLDTKEIAGKITFISGSTGYNNITDKPDLSVYALGSYVDTIAAGLQDQIDGVIDSWFYAYTPTTGNYPANEWTTDTLKQRHIGDTFTNTEEYVDDLTTPDAGKSWRWVNNSGVYSWTPIADSDAVKALQAAAAAQDTADGKRRVFTAQPANADAYDVGDLWANATYSTTYANDLLKCKTAKAAGAAFSIAHWEKASKYTDDTVATAAATAAANAQTSANTANTLLADIAADNKLTPVEKSSVRAEWDTIAAEKSVNDAQADTFGITTEKTTYGTKFQALATYLNNGTTWSSGIPSWIADANLGTTTDIVGATFRLKFKEYYDARTALLNAIAAKAKALADAAQTTANAAQTAATNAATAASNAQTSANAANTLLSDIASDSKLTPSEKQSTKQEWDIIVSEKTKIDAQADVYGVSKTAYGTAYTALSDYITPLLSNLTTTSDIVGTTFRTNFKNYYDARQDILNAISTAAKTLADNAQSATDLLGVSASGAVFMDAFAETQSQYALRWTNYSGEGNPTITAKTDATGGNVLVIGNNDGNDAAWLVGKKSIPFDSNRLYVIKAKVRRLSGSGTMYIGIAGRDSTDSIWINTDGNNSVYSQHYFAASALNASSEWVECVGYFKGYATSGNGGYKPNPLTPGTCHSDVRYIRPLVAVDYSAQAGIAEIDYVLIDFADAQGAQASADNAATAAANAQISANTANAAIANISSDNVLSASEKSGERSRWNDIAAEKSGINAQANAYGITTENAAYNTSFQNLANYLNNGATWSSGVPSWIADANLATNTTIVGATYRSMWNAYFTARQTLMNAISAKAKTLADAAQTTANSKSRHFIETPTPPYRIGDLWTDTNVLLRCKTARLTGSFSAADWEQATKYDNTQTVIDGGLITSGTMQVAGSTQDVKAGITGNGTSNDSVRFWSGSTYASRANAPFRVLQNGSLFASAGKVASWQITDNSLYSKVGLNETLLNSSDGSIEFKYDGLTKMMLKNSDLPTVDSLVTPVIGSAQTGANYTITLSPGNNEFINEFIASGSYTAPNSFTVPNSLLTIKTMFSLDANPSSINVTIALIDNSTSALVVTMGIVNIQTIKNEQGWWESVGLPFYTAAINVPSGTYKVRYTFSASSLNPDSVIRIGSFTSSENIASYTQEIKATYIGRNGFLSFWDSSKYFVVSTRESYFISSKGNVKLFSPNGTYEMRLTDSLIYLGGSTYRLEVSNSKILLRSPAVVLDTIVSRSSHPTGKSAVYVDITSGHVGELYYIL